MKKSTLTCLLLFVLAVNVFAVCFQITETTAQTTPDVYIGIDVAYGGVAEAKAAIDRVSAFTNLVVIGSTGVTWFQDRVNETYQYAYDKGLSIISLRPSLMQGTFGDSAPLNETAWFDMAQNRWGDQLLGFYILDEPGGRQIDGKFEWAWNNFTGQPNSYAQAASMFTEGVSRFLSSQRAPLMYPYKTYTSDYALYWYDYKAGYDVVFAEMGWNYSRQVYMALCRGAAEAQNKQWGAIITWSFTEAPFMESGEQLYNDMVLAYDNGAKYIIVFDSNEQGGSTLTQEHYDAIQRFWNYAQINQPKIATKYLRTAYVLPNAWGFGFRWPTDHIWGVWEADALAPNITKSVGTLLDIYDEELDIIYDDGTIVGNGGYRELIFWNTYDPTPTPSPSPSPSPTQVATPTTNPTRIPPAIEPLITKLAIVAAIALPAIIASALLFSYYKKRKS
jgi:hypothetical protein